MTRRAVVPSLVMVIGAVLGLGVAAMRAGRPSTGTTTTPVRVSAGAGCLPYWSSVATPNPGVANRTLNGVDVSASGSMVAGGDYSLADKSRRPLLVRWDGSRLIHDAEPATTGEHVVNGVSAVSSSLAFAVGSFNRIDRLLPAIERFDGAVWTDMAGVPRPDPKGVVVNDIDALGPDDAWAVGHHYLPSGVVRPLLLRWSGTTWSNVVAPADRTQYSAYLHSVVMLASDDVWAVGYRSDGGPYRTLALHFDGSEWSAVTTPSAGDAATMLNDVSFADAQHGWAVGVAQGTNRLQPFLMAWDGTAWTTVDLGADPANDRSLLAVSAVAQDEAWAAGGAQSGVGPEATFALHFDGRSWAQVSMPTGDASSEIADMATGPQGESWAVGNRGSSALAARICPGSITASGFSPSALTVPLGTTVVWRAAADNPGPVQVRSAFVSTVALEPGAPLRRTFVAAGTYGLEAGAAPANTATISVPMSATPTAGGPATRFRIVWASAGPGPGQVHDVQIRRPGSGSFVNWRTSVRSRSAGFVRDAGPGIYEFRSRLRTTASAAVVGDWSPVQSITVG